MYIKINRIYYYNRKGCLRVGVRSLSRCTALASDKVLVDEHSLKVRNSISRSVLN